MNRILAALSLLLALIHLPALAAETVSFSFAGCTDTMNRPIPSRADPAASKLVDVILDAGQRVIVYNPSAQPQLLPETRAFFYAHACAITRLGLPIDRERSAAQTQRADCWAFDAMRRSGLLKSADAASAIQSDMDLTPEVWALVPGAQRKLDPALCSGASPARGDSETRLVQGNALKLDSPNASPAWNACTRNCGNRLYACGRGATCQSSFEQCTKGCEGR